MRIAVLSLATLITCTFAALAQDIVRFRERTGHSDQPIQETKGKVEAESLAGVKINGKTIPAGDIVDIEYEIPGGLRIDYREAKLAEDGRKSDEAARRYRVLSAAPAATNSKSLKRYFDYKYAWITAARADAGPKELQAAIAALAKFSQDHPEAWQRVPVVRLLTRLHLDTEPPNFDAARKAYEDLAAAATGVQEVKAECQFAIVNLYLAQKNFDMAHKTLGTISSNDPRVPAYQIACAANPANAGDTVKKLQELLARADDALKPTIYNLLGDCARLDPKTEKEALFSYLKVHLIYNQDPVATAKAQDRISELFKKMNQDERAKMYHDMARGR